jgi:outer membrane protein assembly factor BamA
LKEKLGPVSPIVEPRNPIGRPIGSIASIEFHGLRKISTRQLMGEIRSRVGDPLDPAILSGDLKRLYATNLFENVDYSVEPLAGQGYRLTFLLQEAPLNTLGASIRYDKEYKFVALAEFTARQIFNTSSTLTLSSQFGGLEDHSLALRIIPPQLSALFLEPRVNISRLDRSDIRNKEQVDTFRDKRVGGQLMLGGTFGLLEVAAGYRQESVSIRGGSEPNRQEDSVSLAGLTFRINRDTLDQQEFAQKGMVLRLQVDKRFKTLGGDLDYSRWEAGLRPFISISEKSTLELSAVAGYSRGPLPFYERFYAGAYSFAGKGPHHFLGFSRDELAANQLAMLAASYRYRIFSHPISFARRGFLFGTFNFAAVSSQETSPYDFTYFNGGGFGLAIDTLLGPARIALGWGSSGKPKLYISMGPTF